MQFSLSRDVAFGLASWWKAASGTRRHQQGCCWQTSLPSSETKKRSKKLNSFWPLMTIEETACGKAHGFKSCVSSIVYLQYQSHRQFLQKWLNPDKSSLTIPRNVAKWLPITAPQQNLHLKLSTEGPTNHTGYTSHKCTVPGPTFHRGTSSHQE